MTLKKNILNVFLVIMMVLCLTSCKSSKLMIEEININQLEKLIENKEDFILQISLEQCPYCLELRSIEEDLVTENSITIYEYTVKTKNDMYLVEGTYSFKYGEGASFDSFFSIELKQNKDSYFVTKFNE